MQRVVMIIIEVFRFGGQEKSHYVAVATFYVFWVIQSNIGRVLSKTLELNPNLNVSTTFNHVYLLVQERRYALLI